MSCWYLAFRSGLKRNKSAFDILDVGVKYFGFGSDDEGHMHTHSDGCRIDRPVFAEEGNTTGMPLPACGSRAMKVGQPPAKPVTAP